MKPLYDITELFDLSNLIDKPACLNLFARFYFDKRKIYFYQSPLILTELFQHNLINDSYLTACYLNQVMMTLHFLNDVANDAELTQKNKKIRHNRQFEECSTMG